MTRQEFLDMLRKALNRELEAAEVEENIRFYDQYIREQVAQGKAETQVTEQLGDPRLIAKTILQVDEQKEAAGPYRQFASQETVYMEDPDGDGRYTQASDQSQYETWQEDGRGGMRMHTFQVKGWMVALVLVGICLVLFTVLGVAAAILWRLLPVLVVIWAVVWIYRHFFGGGFR